MIRNYFKIAWRNLVRHKTYSLINIGGLSLGMAVFLLISLWVWDELSYNTSFENYSSIAQLYQNRTFNGETDTYRIVPQPISKELSENYPDFVGAVLAVENENIIAHGDKIIKGDGMSVEFGFPAMFSMNFLKGDQQSLREINSVLLSQSFAEALFGDIEPMGKLLRIDNEADLLVSGIYEDFPANSEFDDISFLNTFEFYRSIDALARESEHSWGSNDFLCFVQKEEGVEWGEVQAKFKGLLFDKVDESEHSSNPELIIQPMENWHLHDSFSNGKNTGGAIDLVWLFAWIGIIVLLLASINFMNLSTARSETRAREVGVRKAIGSLKAQLVSQFLSESFLTVALAACFAMGIVLLTLPWFNDLTDKSLSIPFENPIFWSLSLSFIVATSMLAGLYPAFFLSAISPVNALKGNYRPRKISALPRKSLVLLQFTASIILSIGTLIVYDHIQYIKDRPIGYDSDGLLAIYKNTPDLQALDYEVLRSDLMDTGAVDNMAESSNSITSGGALQSGFSWDGMDAETNLLINVTDITHDYGETVGFDFIEGRNFSREFGLDQEGVILNKTAADMIGKDKLLGEIIRRDYGATFKVLGVIKDIINESPFEAPLPSMYFLNYGNRNVINIRIKSELPASQALASIAEVMKQHNPAAPFDFRFVDKDFARKYAYEEMIGQLAFIFAMLAIVISVLGLFGLSSFMVLQRSREIGIRRILGASVFNLWTLLTKDYSLLVLLALAIASPLAWQIMDAWIQNYNFHQEISIWVFVMAGIGAISLSLITVSYQSIRAAMQKPVNNLKTE
ncbi:MAG: FtsX-like permease family protein [Bacteroidia bacterium]|nr:FtsX-like permease family protein [Bacteroidia bacterium]